MKIKTEITRIEEVTVQSSGEREKTKILKRIIDKGRKALCRVEADAIAHAQTIEFRFSFEMCKNSLWKVIKQFFFFVI